jgi:hypothetical protein
LIFLKKTKCLDLSRNTAEVEEKVPKNPEGRKVTSGMAKETMVVERAARTLMPIASEEVGMEAATLGMGDGCGGKKSGGKQGNGNDGGSRKGNIDGVKNWIGVSGNKNTIDNGVKNGMGGNHRRGMKNKIGDHDHGGQ